MSMQTACEVHHYFPVVALKSRKTVVKNEHCSEWVKDHCCKYAGFFSAESFGCAYKFCLLCLLGVVTEACDWFNAVVLQYQVLSQLSGRFVCQKLQRTLFEVERLLLRPNEGNRTSRGLLPRVDRASRFLCWLRFIKVTELFSNNPLYGLLNEYLKLNKLNLQECCSPSVFQALEESVTNYLNAVWLRAAPLDTTELDEGGNVLIRCTLQPALTWLHRNLLLLLSAARLVDPKLDMTRHRYSNKGMVHVKNVLR